MTHCVAYFNDTHRFVVLKAREGTLPQAMCHLGRQGHRDQHPAFVMFVGSKLECVRVWLEIATANEGMEDEGYAVVEFVAKQDFEVRKAQPEWIGLNFVFLTRKGSGQAVLARIRKITNKYYAWLEWARHTQEREEGL